jgi:hypothetical protein
MLVLQLDHVAPLVGRGGARRLCSREHRGVAQRLVPWLVAIAMAGYGVAGGFGCRRHDGFGAALANARGTRRRSSQGSLSKRMDATLCAELTTSRLAGGGGWKSCRKLSLTRQPAVAAMISPAHRSACSAASRSSTSLACIDDLMCWPDLCMLPPGAFALRCPVRFGMFLQQLPPPSSRR